MIAGIPYILAGIFFAYIAKEGSAYIREVLTAFNRRNVAKMRREAFIDRTLSDLARAMKNKDISSKVAQLNSDVLSQYNHIRTDMATVKDIAELQDAVNQSNRNLVALTEKIVEILQNRS